MAAILSPTQCVNLWLTRCGSHDWYDFMTSFKMAEEIVRNRMAFWVLKLNVGLYLNEWLI